MNEIITCTDVTVHQRKNARARKREFFSIRRRIFIHRRRKRRGQIHAGQNHSRHPKAGRRQNRNRAGRDRQDRVFAAAIQRAAPFPRKRPGGGPLGLHRFDRNFPVLYPRAQSARGRKYASGSESARLPPRTTAPYRAASSNACCWHGHSARPSACCSSTSRRRDLIRSSRPNSMRRSCTYAANTA